MKNWVKPEVSELNIEETACVGGFGYIIHFGDCGEHDHQKPCVPSVPSTPLFPATPTVPVEDDPEPAIDELS